MGTNKSLFTIVHLLLGPYKKDKDCWFALSHEIAFRNNWIDEVSLVNYIKSIEGSEYSENLASIINQ